ncbi:hypothetical protein Rs2_16866 [Raphanus sativus]|nr:hypothetical protein Rs2_16866 [Raphanus sativus]
MSSSTFISLLVVHFRFQMLRIHSFLQTEERDTRRSLCQRRELRFLVFTVVLPAVLPTCSVCSPAMNREDSLATVVLKFTETFSGELHSGCRRESYTVDLSRTLQLLMELRSQRSSPHFLSPGSETAKLPRVAPFHLYGARVQGNSSPDLNLIGRYSLSSPTSELPYPLVCPSLNGGSACLHQTSFSTSGFHGHSAYSGELVSPPVSTVYFSVDVCCTISDLQFRSTTMSPTLLAFALEPKRSMTKWAWPNSFYEAAEPIIKI